MNQNFTLKIYKKYNGQLFVLLVLTLIALFAGTGLFIQPALTKIWVFNESTSAIGDTIGGITSPILGLLTISLIYLTYSDQRKFIIDSKRNMDNENEAKLFQSLMDYYREMKPLLNNEEVLSYSYKEQVKIWQKFSVVEREIQNILIARIIHVTLNMLDFINGMNTVISTIKNDNYRNLLDAMLYRFYKGSVQYHVAQLSEWATLIKFNDLDKIIRELNKIQSIWITENVPTNFWNEYNIQV